MAPGWELPPRVSAESNGWAAHSPTDVELTPVVLNFEPWRPIRVTVHVPALQQPAEVQPVTADPPWRMSSGGSPAEAKDEGACELLLLQLLRVLAVRRIVAADVRIERSISVVRKPLDQRSPYHVG